MKSRLTRGFTLIELLVVISIIALLIALLLPALQSSRTTASLIQSGAQLRDLQLSLHRYCADNRSNTPWVRFPRSFVSNSSYYNGGGSPFKYYYFPWSAVLWDKLYVEDWRAFWSPSRDLRASWTGGGLSLFTKLTTTTANEMTTRDTSSYGGQNLSYWGMVGYGMVGVDYGDPNTVDGQYVKTNVTNLDTARVPLGNAISMAESWSSANQTPGNPPAAGMYWIQPSHQPTSNTTYLYNYNSSVARAYWDAHVSTSESNSIGWNCSATNGTYVGTPYGGTWTYTWWSGITGYMGTRPWYADTVTYPILN